MGLIAALVVSTILVAGDGPTYHQPQTWDGPTRSDLRHCADMAKELTLAYRAIQDKGINHDWQERWATCELYPSDSPDQEDDAEPAPATLQF